MKVFVHRAVAAGFGIVVLVVLAGCAASGPAYQPATLPTEGKGLVYIYRPGKFMGGGVSFDIHTGPKDAATEITDLKSGGYFPYYSLPGEVTLWAKTESTASVTLDVKADETYYVRGSVGIGVIVARPQLTIVDDATGAEEIKACKLLEPK